MAYRVSISKPRSLTAIFTASMKDRANPQSDELLRRTASSDTLSKASRCSMVIAQARSRPGPNQVRIAGLCMFSAPMSAEVSRADVWHGTVAFAVSTMGRGDDRSPRA